MVLSDPVRNTYEEFPIELKERLSEAEAEKGATPSHTESRETLIHNHKWHLRFLVEGVLQPRNFVLPAPYTPSRVNFACPNPTIPLPST